MCPNRSMFGAQSGTVSMSLLLREYVDDILACRRLQVPPCYSLDDEEDDAEADGGVGGGDLLLNCIRGGIVMFCVLFFFLLFSDRFAFLRAL